MCAQEWLTGKILTPYDMNRKQIINILNRLHRSRPLMKQLSRLGYTMEKPVDLLRSWQQEVPEILKQNHYLNSVIAELGKTVPGFREDHATIVHGDRMFDVADMLCHYIPEQHWHDWLTYYGYKYNQTVLDKLYWYGQYSYLNQIAKYCENQDLDNVNREIYALRVFRDKYGKKR